MGLRDAVSFPPWKAPGSRSFHGRAHVRESGAEVCACGAGNRGASRAALSRASSAPVRRLLLNLQSEKGRALGVLWRAHTRMDIPSSQLEFSHKVLALLFHLAGKP